MAWTGTALPFMLSCCGAELIGTILTLTINASNKYKYHI
jgi:hypothetical protein